MPLLATSPFLEAVASSRDRRLLATSLSHRELARLDAQVKQLSVFSARVESLRFLTEVADITDAILGGPTPEQLATREAERAAAVAAGKAPRYSRPLLLSEPEAVLRLQQLAIDEGLQPDNPDLQGTIQDPTSDARARLIVRTQRELMQGAGRHIQQQNAAALDLWPCLELVRVIDPADPAARRDWHRRWDVAAEASGDTDAAECLRAHGRMVARKDSPIWAELGNPANFTDGLGNEYAPFAFNSGMRTENVRRDRAEALGVIAPDAPAPAPQPVDLLTALGAKADAFDAALLEAVQARGDIFIDEDNVLRARADRFIATAPPQL